MKNKAMSTAVLYPVLSMLVGIISIFALTHHLLPNAYRYYAEHLLILNSYIREEEQIRTYAAGLFAGALVPVLFHEPFRTSGSPLWYLTILLVPGLAVLSATYYQIIYLVFPFAAIPMNLCLYHCGFVKRDGHATAVAAGIIIGILCGLGMDAGALHGIDRLNLAAYAFYGAAFGFGAQRLFSEDDGGALAISWLGLLAVYTTCWSAACFLCAFVILLTSLKD